jgi:hypothetical protein
MSSSKPDPKKDPKKMQDKKADNKNKPTTSSAKKQEAPRKK